MKTVMKPRVTIGLPVYNGEEILPDAIESVLLQSFKEFVVIISDNASTDNTEKICEEFLSKDSRIKYIRQEKNLGPVGNFNFVKDQADTEYFIWLACDDRWEKDFLENAVAAMDTDSSVALVFSNFIVRNLETGVEQQAIVRNSISESAFERSFYRIINMVSSIVYGLQRLEVVRDIELELFDYSDVYYSLQIAIKGKLQILPKIGYIAGVKGKRIAYSLTGKKVSQKIFLRKILKLYFKCFSFVKAITLYGVLLIVMLKQKISLEVAGFIAKSRRT
jgi:glycosyltransferase involved in cell wall biosynthesis